MAGRALRSLPLVQSWLELSTLDHPQWVNEEGFEVDTRPIKEDALEEAGAGDDEVAAEGDGDVAMDVDEPEEQVVTPGEEEVEPQEPLLNLKESQIFPYALLQTRQHHLQHLLPHIFTHPPIPSHNKPRARGPPKGTFLFPTPGPLSHPLPIPEYHGGRSAPPQPTTDASPTPAEGSESPKSPAPAPTGKKSKKEARVDEDAPPAHEMDCIARVTLSVGPISFPSTELWVGRFVEPRAKTQKVRRPKGEAKERKRSLAEDAALRRARMGSTSTPSGSPSVRPPMRPPMGAPTEPRPAFGPTAPPVRPGPSPPTASSSTPRLPAEPKTNISPALIQLVNQAAGRHPWLLTIIHKAARSLATKEELSKLGRVVARLSRGEDVGEGPTDGLTPATTASSSSSISPPAGPAAGPSAPRPPAAASVPSAPTQPQQPAEATTKAADDSDSDGEVDMKGPKQVGGGPLPPIDPPERPPPPRESSIESSLSSAPSTPVVVPPPLPQLPPIGPPPLITTAPRPPPPMPSVLLPPKSAMPSPLGNHPVGPAPPPQGPFPPGYLPPRPATLPPPPLIPPKPQYPTLPRFLLVAFKEARTEKYMLPLGKNSYVSRIGGDYVTDPPPPIVLPTPAPAPAPVPAAVAESAPAPEAPLEGGKRRTRQSLAAEAPAPKPEPPKDVEPKVEPEPEPEPKKLPPSSNLPPLPGGNPPKGTVLISTFVPVQEWLKPDWTAVEKGLPWLNPALMKPKVAEAPPPRPKTPPPATEPPLPAGSTNPPSSPTRSLRHPPRPSQPDHPPPKKDIKPKIKGDRLLNFGSHNFLPGDDEEMLQPITIRLEGIDDSTWRKMKLVMEEIEGYELKYLAEDEPELLADLPADHPPPAQPAPGIGSPGVPPPPAAPFTRPMLAASRLGFSLPQINTLRKRLHEIRKTTFNSLLSRVPPRSFLRFRVESTDSTIADALVDKWAPRPYPISTKPLYATNAAGEEDFESAPVYLSPEKPTKRRRGEEETVTFELPQSFDALDEMVEEGARLSMTTGRGRGRGGRGGKVDDGRKRHGKRWTPGAICEGCGLPKKVWRHGPNGRRTLCNACGDAFVEGTLGELKAPGASSGGAANGDEGAGAGDDSMEVDGPEVKTEAEEDGEGQEKSEERAAEMDRASPLERGDAAAKPTDDNAPVKSLSKEAPQSQDEATARQDAQMGTVADPPDRAQSPKPDAPASSVEP